MTALATPAADRLDAALGLGRYRGDGLLAGASALPAVPVALRGESTPTMGGMVMRGRIRHALALNPWAVGVVERCLPLRFFGMIVANMAKHPDAKPGTDLGRWCDEVGHSLEVALAEELAGLDADRMELAQRITTSALNYGHAPYTVEGAPDGKGRTAAWAGIMSFHLVGMLLDLGLVARLEEGTARHAGIESVLSGVTQEHVDAMGTSARKGAVKVLARLRDLGLYGGGA